MSVAGGHQADPAVAGAPTLRQRVDVFLTPSGLLLAAVVVLTMFAVTSAIRDPDFWWHLRAGQLILAKGGLLGTDPFTYTAASHHWTMHEWLFESLTAAAFSAAGLGIVILVLSAVTWAGLMLVAMRARMRAPSRGALAAGILLAAIAGYPIWGPRVQMLTFFFSAVTLFVLERHLTRGSRSIWLLVPMFLVWSNLHSGFVIGLGFIALVVIAEAMAPYLGMPDAGPTRRLRPLLLVLLACAAVSMINPNGPGILLYAFQTQTSVAQQSLIAEWHSPDFHQLVLLPYGAMLVSLLLFIAANRRLSARDAALVLATTALSLQSVRHIALFIVAATPVWIDQLSLFVQRRRGTAPRRRRAQPSFRFRATVLAVVVIALFGGYLGGRLLPAMAVQPNTLSYAEEFPVCAARWLEGASQPLRIFNQYGEGGYLADALSAKGDKVYIFGDAALMGDPLLYEYASIETLQPGWDAAI
ncbi:MAG: hypothetical protein JOY68_10750, partial [Candidatus Dormibacteraeota bacterium]|nr:hypothetical protein [Candidatus Dormibacteraeota bacterium]